MAEGTTGTSGGPERGRRATGTSPPRIAGRFEVLGALGETALAKVYRVRDHAHGGGERVLEILRGEAASEEVDFERLAEEVAALSALAAPPGAEGLAPPLDLGRTDLGLPYLVRDWIPGETLAALLARRGALLPLHALEIARQTLAALAPLHPRGLAHGHLRAGDVLLRDRVPATPENPFGVGVLVTGLALGPLAARVLRARGAERELAPELRAGAPATPAADVWAVAALLRRMLGDEDEAPSAELRALLARAGAEEAGERYGSAAEMAAAVDEVLTLELARFAVPRSAEVEATRPPADRDRAEAEAQPSEPPSVESPPAEASRPLAPKELEATEAQPGEPPARSQPLAVPRSAEVEASESVAPRRPGSAGEGPRAPAPRTPAEAGAQRDETPPILGREVERGGPARALALAGSGLALLVMALAVAAWRGHEVAAADRRRAEEAAAALARVVERAEALAAARDDLSGEAQELARQVAELAGEGERLRAEIAEVRERSGEAAATSEERAAALARLSDELAARDRELAEARERLDAHELGTADPEGDPRSDAVRRLARAVELLEADDAAAARAELAALRPRLRVAGLEDGGLVPLERATDAVAALGRARAAEGPIAALAAVRDAEHALAGDGLPPDAPPRSTPSFAESLPDWAQGAPAPDGRAVADALASLFERVAGEAAEHREELERELDLRWRTLLAEADEASVDPAEPAAIAAALGRDLAPFLRLYAARLARVSGDAGAPCPAALAREPHLGGWAELAADASPSDAAVREVLFHRLARDVHAEEGATLPPLPDALADEPLGDDWRGELLLRLRLAHPAWPGPPGSLALRRAATRAPGGGTEVTWRVDRVARELEPPPGADRAWEVAQSFHDEEGAPLAERTVRIVRAGGTTREEGLPAAARLDPRAGEPARWEPPSRFALGRGIPAAPTLGAGALDEHELEALRAALAEGAPWPVLAVEEGDWTTWWSPELGPVRRVHAGRLEEELVLVLPAPRAGGEGASGAAD